MADVAEHPCMMISSSSAISEYAHNISRSEVESWRRLHELQSSRYTAAVQELDDVAEECREPDWDAAGALAISHASLANAREFLAAIPFGVEFPTIGAAPDGTIMLGWHKSPQRTLSVNVSPTAKLPFAARIDERRTRGVEVLGRSIPLAILNLIHDIARQ